MNTLRLWYHRLMSSYYLKRAQNAPCGNMEEWGRCILLSAKHTQAMMEILKKEIKHG